jgi:hypothetical protein
MLASTHRAALSSTTRIQRDATLRCQYLVRAWFFSRAKDDTRAETDPERRQLGVQVGTLRRLAA